MATLAGLCVALAAAAGSATPQAARASGGATTFLEADSRGHERSFGALLEDLGLGSEAALLARRGWIHTQKVDRAGLPVSTTMRCIITLTAQYFVIYTLAAIVRTASVFRGTRHHGGPTQKVLESATNSVCVLPMLCVLFLAARMRAVQLSHGDQGDPQWWACLCMRAAVCATAAQLLLAISVPVVTGKAVGADEFMEVAALFPQEVKAPPNQVEGLGQSGGLATPGGWWRATVMALHALRCVSTLVVLSGCAGVCAAVVVMQAPEGAPTPRPSAGIECTVGLAVQFFAVHVLCAGAQAWDVLRGRRTSRAAQVLKLTLVTVVFAPMLSILFIGAEMRRLEVDPRGVHPQAWMESCIYACSYAILLQTTLALLVPLLPGGDVRRGAAEGDVDLVLPARPWICAALVVLRYSAMAVVYGGFVAVSLAVLTAQNASGEIPPVSPAMRCVIVLSAQFFAVHLALWILVTVRECMGPILSQILWTTEAALATVQFCPMLGVLFIGLRMRAQVITDGRGAPQLWAQYAMYLCTFSLLLQLLTCVIMSAATLDAPDMEEDGISKGVPSGNRALTALVLLLKGAAFVALYGGVTAVCVALFVITPQTATISGAATDVAESRLRLR